MRCNESGWVYWWGRQPIEQQKVSNLIEKIEKGLSPVFAPSQTERSLSTLVILTLSTGLPSIQYIHELQAPSSLGWSLHWGKGWHAQADGLVRFSSSQGSFEGTWQSHKVGCSQEKDMVLAIQWCIRKPLKFETRTPYHILAIENKITLKHTGNTFLISIYKHCQMNKMLMYQTIRIAYFEDMSTTPDNALVGISGWIMEAWSWVLYMVPWPISLTLFPKIASQLPWTKHLSPVTSFCFDVCAWKPASYGLNPKAVNQIKPLLY